MANSDHAFEQIHRANRFIRIMTVIALGIMLIMTAVTLVRVNQIAQNQQAETLASNKRTEQLIKELRASSDRQLNNIADYLECIAKTNPINRTPTEVQTCLDILRRGGSDSTGFFMSPTTRQNLVGLLQRNQYPAMLVPAKTKM